MGAVTAVAVASGAMTESPRMTWRARIEGAGLLLAAAACVAAVSPLPASAQVGPSAAEAAAKLCPLKIRKSCFVLQVFQFGVYEPIRPQHVFLPGGCGVLYLELQNAPSLPAELPAGGKGFVTRLSGSTSWLDSEGKPFGTSKPLEHTEYTRSPVRDYFLKIEFDVPSLPGNYTLAVELFDPATKRKARQAVELKVGS